MGNVSIKDPSTSLPRGYSGQVRMISATLDISLANIWRSWYLFRKGKRITRELDEFQYYLEDNLFQLWKDLNNKNYQHGGYKEFTVYDSKKRKISVAAIRDRVVHRLIYEYLIPIYDKTFDHDVWSCRKGKGLLGAIERTQLFLKNHKKSYIWRADIKKSNDIIVKPKWGLKFLGVVIYPKGRKLSKSNQTRIEQKLSLKNISSYAGLIKKHQGQKEINKLNWQILESLEEAL